MYAINQISNDAKQTQTLQLPNGINITIDIEYKPNQSGWFLTSLKYNDFVITGLRIVVSPNMLQQFENQIPFGLACETTNNQEPTQQTSFTDGTSFLYILDDTEVQAYRSYLNGR